MINLREIILGALMEIVEEEQYSHIVLKEVLEKYQYLEKRDRYKAEIRNTIGQEQWDIYKEQLLMFFLYTYFCGAVYDDMIYSKGVLSVISVFWIEEITFWSWAADEGQIEEKNLLETAYRYAREIEHSDENLNLLEEIFDSDERYEPEALRCIFVRERKQHE